MHHIDYQTRFCVVRGSAAGALVIVCLIALAERLSAEQPSGEPAIAASDEAVVYNRDIRPILTDHCFACHGPDSASREAGLRLDRKDDAVAAGAVVAGDPEASELIRRIELAEDDDMAMPPASGHKRLSAEQKEKLRRWIAQGAEYQSHWSFIAPQRSELPQVSDPSWVRNPIDQFILAGLDRVGLSPAPQADRRTLARRASLDITGLPPAVDAVEAFVRDESPDAYERYVDSLLDSKRYGEHRGRYWLDYARYGDTHGIHFDNYREMWSYRDWVIDAFNRNLPFDQFTIEQLAGDLLPEPTLDQLVATGFNRCNITTNEGGIIDEEYKVLYTRDRTETTSLVWMAMTTGCAVCHDHKFDPISQREFYSLSAFFNNTTQPVRDGNVHNTPPIIPVPLIEDRERFAEMDALIAGAQSDAESIRGRERERFDTVAGQIDADRIAGSIPDRGLAVHAPLGEGAGPAAMLLSSGKALPRIAEKPLSWAEGHTAPASLQINSDSYLSLGEPASELEYDSTFSYGAWVRLSGDNITGAVLAKMDDTREHRGWDLWLEGNRVGAHIIHRWPDNAIKVTTKAPLAKDQWHHVFITYDGSGKAEGLQIFIGGVRQDDRTVSGRAVSDTIRNEVPLNIGARSSSAIAAGVRVNDVRVYTAQLTADEVAQVAIASRLAYLAAQPAASRSAEATQELFSWWLQQHSPQFLDASSKLTALQEERSAIVARGTIAHIMTERDAPPEAFVLARGEYHLPGEKVGAAVPEIFPPMSDELPRNRLGLAKWLLQDDHPLTARVAVNRFWQEVFGTGLVESSGDFGVSGELPVNPELLDWLAVEFRESGWDVKRLIRLMVTSATYRQSAETTEQKLNIDPTNRLLARGPRFRMDAEMIRDSMLAVSDLLSAKIGGPSVKPYQPEGVWEAVAMRGSNTRDYRQDSGENLYRRSLYTFWKRSAPPASMDVFNAPSREVCTIQRDRTNTPLQALAALNDPQGIEAARHLAAIAIRSASEAAVRIDVIAKRVLARPLEEQELELVSQSLHQLLEHYADQSEAAAQLIAVGETTTPADLAPAELAAYTLLANQFMNLDEALTK